MIVSQMIRTVSQKKNEFNQGVSVRIFMHSTPNRDGKSTAFLQNIIDRKKREYNLKVSWPLAFFEDKKETALIWSTLKHYYVNRI